MLEQIILGIIQGITEWLPISSEGVIVLVAKNFFDEQALEIIIKQALFLHLGTFLAALIYFRKDVWSLLSCFTGLFCRCPNCNVRTPSINDQEIQKIFKFLVIATLISGFFCFILFKIFSGFEEQLDLSTKAITLIIGLLLLITGGLQIKARTGQHKKASELNNKDGLLLGFMQGLSVLPGLSRSGLTISTLLLRKFDETFALKLSFLMSLPIVLGGNIILNLNCLEFSLEMLLGLIFSFVFGLITIDLLLKLAKKINFGYFILIFAALVLASVFI